MRCTTIYVVLFMIASASFCLAEQSQSHQTVNLQSAATNTNPVPAWMIATAMPSESGRPYTSVIIDTLGLQLDRCMSPKIRRHDGSEVWGTMSVDLDFVENVGIVGYATSIEAAKTNPRCGSNPMIIKAIERAGGNFKSDPVISNPDADLLLSENAKGKFLEKFNVIIIKDGRL